MQMPIEYTGHSRYSGTTYSNRAQGTKAKVVSGHSKKKGGK